MTSRETHNLFFYAKRGNWKSFWYRLMHFDKLTFEDTFMPIVCAMVGHKKYLPEPKYSPDEFACKRCHKFILK